MRFFITSTTGNVTDFLPNVEQCLCPGSFNLIFVRSFIDIEDLSSLLSLIKDYPIIIDRVDYRKDISEFEIEVYNDFRE